METEWRFVCEALVNISALRFFLSPTSGGFRERTNLSAALRFSSRLELVCEWQEEEEPQSLRVVLPLCALDHEAPVQAFSHEGHIEVKLRLLDSRLFLPSIAPKSSLASDVQELSRRIQELEVGDTTSRTDLFCRACNARLTKGGFRLALELPSVDWQDLADHWFGICCGGSGLRTGSIVARFESNVSPQQGKLLVASTTCIVHLEDLCNEAGRTEACTDTEASKGTDNDCSLWEVPSGPPSATADCCSSAHCDDHVEKQAIKSSLSASFYDFLRGPIQPLNSGIWQPLRCGQCMSLVGTFGTTNERAVHLFKRRVTAGTAAADAFRCHTLEKDFLDELRARSSYRYVVRDLVQQKPMIQLVVMNEESLLYFGTVPPSKGDMAEASLKPAICLMFSDCRDVKAEEARKLDEWTVENKADEIFMLEEEIVVLLDKMVENHRYYPSSCSVTQHLRLSFITG